MTGLLVFIVLVFIGVAVWQLTKIFHLTQVGASENSEILTIMTTTLMDT